MTHYEILAVSGGASNEEIKSAYQSKIQHCAPEMEADMTRAYEVLTDPTAREMYDDYLVRLAELREEVQYQHFVTQQEENRLNDGTLISAWLKLYRLNWRSYSQLSKHDKISKLYAELFFRTFSGIVGIIITTLFLLYAGKVVGFIEFLGSPRATILKYVYGGTFLGFFFSAKLYGAMYRRWKISKRDV